MATKKELALTVKLLHSVAKVNASSSRVNVNVDINHDRVSVRISDPVVVLANCQDNDWDWLFYDDKSAYFSNDVFTEEEFLERCQEFIDIVNGFEGYSAAEVA